MDIALNAERARLEEMIRNNPDSDATPEVKGYLKAVESILETLKNENNERYKESVS